MLRGSKMAAVREHAGAASELAAQLAGDKKFRMQLSSAAEHGSRAKRRVVRQLGSLSLVRRLATDAELRAEVQQMTDDLQAAWERLQSKRNRSHGLRNSLLLAGLGGGVALALRKRRRSKAPCRSRPRTTSGRSSKSSRSSWTASRKCASWATRACAGLRRSVAVAPSGTRRSLSSIPTGRSAGSARTARRPAAPSRASRSAKSG